MAQSTIHEQRISYFRETTVCSPPADWTTDGTAVEFVSCDTSGIVQEHLDDPTAEARFFAVGDRRKIKGVRTCGASLVLKLHGTGVTTADTATVVQTPLADFIEHCMGGLYLGTSTTFTGGTAAVPIVDSLTGLIPGCMIAGEDITSPTAANDGKLWCRRVLSIDVPTKALTLAEVLPFTPAATDPCHAVATGYLVADVLVDAVASAGAPHTFCYYIAHGSTSAPTDLLWRVDGAVASMAIEGLGRGELPTLNLDIMGANFAHGTTDGLTNVDLGVPAGFAQLSMGLDVVMSIQTYGNTAINSVDANAVSFEPGYTRAPVNTTTERTHRFEGLATWTVAPGQTRLKCTILPYDEDFYAALAAGTDYRITLTQPGMGSGAGAGWCLHIPRAQLVTTPGRADVDGVHGMPLEFEAREPADASGGSNTDLKLSRFTLSIF